MAAALLERLAWNKRTGRDRDPRARRELRATQVSRRIADFLLGDETLTPPFPGLLRYLAWTAMARFLRPVVNVRRLARPDRWLAGIAPPRIPVRNGPARRRRPRA
jgi:hypothetical protein